jgi:hypothetical protein
MKAQKAVLFKKRTKNFLSRRAMGVLDRAAHGQKEQTFFASFFQKRSAS